MPQAIKLIIRPGATARTGHSGSVTGTRFQVLVCLFSVCRVFILRRLSLSTRAATRSLLRSCSFKSLLRS